MKLYCKYLSKSLNGVLKCKLYKKHISYQNDCQNCLDFILVQNKPIKKVSKKRIFVQKEIYEKVFNRDNGKCQLADKNCQGNLELHHILYRSERKDLINEPNNCIMLCNYHHKIVHSNKHKWQPILLEKMQIFNNKNVD